MPEKHAILSASASARWLHCTAAPRYEELFPDQTSEFAEEGTLAHAIAEQKVRRAFPAPGQSTRAFTAAINKLKKDPKFTDEMDEATDLYVNTVKRLDEEYYAIPAYVTAEIKLDLSEYVPEGFGTCDCLLIGGDLLTIVDFKYGKGVRVDAANNSQMRLYALGALRRYRVIYDSEIRRVRTVIVQPRITDEPSTEELTVEELLSWGEYVRPIARRAFDGEGEYVPGDHCRFCRGREKCAARAAKFSALEDFKDCVPAALAGPGANVLTDAQIGELITKGRGLAKWLEDLEAYALRTCSTGGSIPGWKVVAGRSVRAFSDQDAALAAVIGAGYNEALVYDRKPKSLSELEKMMGKKEFEQVCGAYVVRPEGKPALVPESDKRPAINSAITDFEGVLAPC